MYDAANEHKEVPHLNNNIPDKTRRILFCTDFSSNAYLAFDYAIDAAVRRQGVELFLLHVIPAPDAQYWKNYIYEVNADVDQKAKAAFDKRVNDEYRARVPDGINFHQAFRIGKAYAEIVKFAHEINADLIVMGRQGRGALESIFFGTVAEKVVKKANCPVLVIPLPEKSK